MNQRNNAKQKKGKEELKPSYKLHICHQGISKSNANNVCQRAAFSCLNCSSNYSQKKSKPKVCVRVGAMNELLVQVISTVQTATVILFFFHFEIGKSLKKSKICVCVSNSWNIMNLCQRANLSCLDCNNHNLLFHHPKDSKKMKIQE